MAWAYWTGKKKIKITPFELVDTNPNSRDWWGVDYSPSLGRVVAVGNDNLAYSNDGVNWTHISPPQSNVWRDVVWSEFQSQFVAVSSNGTNRVMTSPDGINWTLRSASLAGQWFSVTYSEKEDLFCASRGGGEFSNPFMTSPDGENWTTRSILSGTFRGNRVQWNDLIELFIAVGSSGSQRVLSSADGITWTDRTVTNNNIALTGLFSHPLQPLVIGGALSGTSAVRHTKTTDGINYDFLSFSGGTHLAWAYNEAFNRVVTIRDNQPSTNDMEVNYLEFDQNNNFVLNTLIDQSFSGFQIKQGTYMKNVKRTVFVGINGFISDNV